MKLPKRKETMKIQKLKDIFIKIKTIDKNKFKMICISSAAALIMVIAAILLLIPEKMDGDIVGCGTIDSFVKGTGSIEAGESIDVLSSVSAVVKTSSFVIGDAVSQNDVLVTYDMTKLTDEKNLAEENVVLRKNELTAAKSNNDLNKSNFNAAKNESAGYENLYKQLMDIANTFSANEHIRNLSIVNAQKSLEKQKVEASKKVENLGNELTALQSELEEKIAYKDSSETEKALKAYNNTINGVRDAIHSKVKDIKKANSELSEIEKKILELPESGLTDDEYAAYLQIQQNLTDVQREWAASKSMEQTSHSQIVSDNSYLPYEAEIAIAEIGLTEASRNYDLGAVGKSSDCDGIISEKYVTPGSVVSVGDKLYTVKSTDQTKAVIQISKYDYPSIETGQDAEIKVGELVYEGKVTKINRVSVTDTAGKAKVSVEITLSNPDDNIIYGLESDATIHTQKKESCIYIAKKNLYSDDEGEFCYVIQKGHIAKQPIETGISDADYVEVISGINEGDQVISEPMTEESVGKRARF